MTEGAASAAYGRSSDASAERAGRHAAEQALKGLAGRSIRGAIVFATVGYDQALLLRSVREALPDGLPVAGCSAEGVIADRVSDEGAWTVLVLAFAGDRVECRDVGVPFFADREVEAGRLLAEQAGGAEAEGVLLVFPDALTGNVSRLIAEVQRGLPRVTVVGGTAGDMMQFERTWQYVAGGVRSDSVAALQITGSVRADVVISHGCTAIGRSRRVTRSSGSVVHEIDGRAAWTLFEGYVDGREGLESDDIVHLCIGDYGQTDTGDECVIRMPLSRTEDDSVVFPGGLEEGVRIRLTRRDPERILEEARSAGARIAEAAPEAFVYLQFDCAGRGRIMFHDEVESHVVHPIRERLPAHIPLCGFHSFGEIGPRHLGRAEYHNYTVALVALSEGGEVS